MPSVRRRFPVGDLAWYEWNTFMCKKLSSIIKDDWTFVDVGANHGEFVDFFRTLKYKKIYAFELNPRTASILKAKYGGTDIIVENYAVCDTDGVVPFFDGGAKSDDTCYNIIGHNMNFEKANSVGSVPSIRLDTYFKDEKIDLIKIDVEGAELQVMEGLRSIINNISFMLLECHLDHEWDRLRGILLDDFNLSCINFYDDSIITKNSHKPYQCLCKKKI
jgi:FkbM family methyltransferase